MTQSRPPKPDSAFPASEYDRTRFDVKPKQHTVNEKEVARQKEILDAKRKAKQEAQRKEEERLQKIASEKAKPLAAKQTNLAAGLEARTTRQIELVEARAKQIAEITAANQELKEKIDALVAQCAEQQASLEVVEKEKKERLEKQPVQEPSYASRIGNFITAGYFATPVTPKVNALPAFEFKAEEARTFELHKETIKRLKDETLAYETRLAQLNQNLLEMKNRKAHIDAQNVQAQKEKETSTALAAKLLAGKDTDPAATLKAVVESVKTATLPAADISTEVKSSTATSVVASPKAADVTVPEATPSVDVAPAADSDLAPAPEEAHRDSPRPSMM